MKKTINDLSELISIVPAVLYEYVVYYDDSKDSCFLFLTPNCKEILGYSPDYFLEDMNRFWEKVNPDDLPRLIEESDSARRIDKLFWSEVRFYRPDGKEIWIRLSSKPSQRKSNKDYIWVGYITDVTERKKTEQEREELIKDLEKALIEVKTLSGLIPICSSCKKIRDDQGYWNILESYIQKRSNAQFSHSMCPECSDKLYGDEDWYIEMKKKKK